jgi:hypothetical protein
MNSRRTRLRSALAVILTVLVLVPTGILFTRVWQDTADRRDSTELEQQGVEYLTALSPLVSSLADAQSTALQGVAEPPGTLQTAVSRVAEVDSRLGDDLNTTPRWAGLQDKISKLSKVTGNPVAVYQAYAETTDLTLALYNKVRVDSELNRDPDNDVSNLQQAVAVDMPTTVVRVSRMGDLANLLPAVNGQARTQIGAMFSYEVFAAQDAVNALTNSLQAAVDDTESETLSGSMVGTLDSFRRGVESMVRGANPGGAPNAATMSTAQSTLQTALSSLSGVTLKEMKGRLDDRMDTLNYRRIEALVLGLLATVLVLAAVGWLAVTRPRPSASTLAPPAGAVPEFAAAGRPPIHRDQSTGSGHTDPTRREWSGAVR